jgi:hypothetical protein
MIVRILSEGQWELSDEAVRALNGLDEAVEQAVASDDQARLGQALKSLHDRVRATGTAVPDDALHDSDLILPAADSNLEDMRRLLNESEEGLIPN